jgi:S-adenosylmethionine:tRNA ribosyltransferase-isomerase
MKTEKLNYHLPIELIAQQPLSIRSDSRLLVLNRSGGDTLDSRFSKLGDFLSPGDCLVLNDTKVLPARFFARSRSTGPKRRTGSPVPAQPQVQAEPTAAAKFEGLFLTETARGNWDVMIKGARKLKPGDLLYLKDKQKGDFCQATVLEKKADGTCRLKLRTDAGLEVILDKIGFPPLPPYIKRGDDPAVAQMDKLRYQTVYALKPGAIAAPTAGLHFTNTLIEQLKQAGICFAYITLHVGTGTFKPITAENLEDHRIHQEWYSIDKKNARIINAAKSKGGRIIAVGTTSTRVLETVAFPTTFETGPPGKYRRSRLSNWRIPPAGESGTTKLFIRPGYKFKITDAMITNFHLPKSTLLALVAAFAGLENILTAYRHAIQQQYRFYSYGDAMLII